MAEYAYLGPVAHDSGNGNLPIHRIVVHCTAGADAKGARGTARYFRDPNATGSAHAVTDPIELVECAHDPVICWHAPPNTHSLGVEICCSLAGNGKGHWTLDSHQKMMHRAAKWVAEKCKLHGIPVRKLTVAQLKANPAVEGICGHVDVSNAFHQTTHSDPGPYFPWAQFMGYVETEYKALGAPTGGTPTPPPTSGDWLTMATPAELATAVETGVGNYMKRFFADGNGTGDAIWDGSRASSAAILEALNQLNTKMDALVTALTPKV